MNERLKAYLLHYGLPAVGPAMYGTSNANRKQSPILKGLGTTLGASTAGIGAGSLIGLKTFRRTRSLPAALLAAALGNIVAGGEATYQLGKAKPGMRKRAGYIDALTRDERAAAMKLGAALALCEHGSMAKTAFGAPGGGGVLDGVAKAIITTSIITGVPLGIASHMIGRGVSANRRREREQLARIKYYRDASRQLESGLTNTPEEEVIQ